MGVKFAVLGGGDVQATSFSDNFNRANANTWGANWVRMYAAIPAGGAGAGATDSIVNNQGVMTGSGGINPVQFYTPIWVPTSLVSGPLYNSRGKFVQVTHISQAGTIGPGLSLNYNRELLNGATTGPFDTYIMPNNGRIDKVVGGGVQSTIGAATWVVAGGDVLRFEGLVNAAGTAITLQSIRNGVVLQTIVDTNPGAILKGFVGPIIYSMAGTPTLDNWIIDDFSCGILSRLS
jgi:hypothetical protein